MFLNTTWALVTHEAEANSPSARGCLQVVSSIRSKALQSDWLSLLDRKTASLESRAYVLSDTDPLWDKEVDRHEVVPRQLERQSPALQLENSWRWYDVHAVFQQRGFCTPTMSSWEEVLLYSSFTAFPAQARKCRDLVGSEAVCATLRFTVEEAKTARRICQWLGFGAQRRHHDAKPLTKRHQFTRTSAHGS